MAILPAPTPDSEKAPPPTVPIHDVVELDSTISSMLSAPMVLINWDYYTNNGNNVSIAHCSGAASKRHASSCKLYTTVARFLLKMQANIAGASTVRAAIIDAASVAASIKNAVVQNTIPFPLQNN